MVKKLSILLSFLLFFFFAPQSVHAASLYLSPGSGTIGASTSVQVRLNTGGEPINGVSAYLSYPTDKLEAIGISYGGSFSIAAEGGYGGGFVNISRASFSGVGGDVNVATVRFRAKTAGTATISFRGGSAAARAADSGNALGGTSGGTYTLKPGQAGTSTTGTTKTTPTPSDRTEPIISDVKVINVATNSATITWKTDDASDSTIEYGLDDGQYFIATNEAKLVTDHSMMLESPLLQPGLTIHFRVKAKNASGKESLSIDQAAQLVGYSVHVRVVDSSGNPIPNATIFLYSSPRKSVTDANGETTFDNVTLGKHVIFVKLQDNTTLSEFTVSETKSTQTVTVRVNPLSTTDSILSRVSPAAVGAGAVSLFAIIGVFIFIEKRKKKAAVLQPQLPQQPPQPTV